MLRCARETQALAGHVVALASHGDESIAAYAEEVLFLPPASELLLPFLAVIPLHLLAYQIAIRRRLGPDRPRNLTKAVVGSA
jgi:glutamine---fructose-6-phosphate transaminase (isomerizing)